MLILKFVLLYVLGILPIVIEAQQESKYMGYYYLFIDKIPLAGQAGPIAILALLIFWPHALQSITKREEGVITLGADDGAGVLGVHSLLLPSLCFWNT